MKNLILLIACFSLLSCEKSMDNLEMAEQSKYSADTRMEARTESSWDSCSECLLPSGQKVALPWVNVVTTSIPDGVRKDVRTEDGWVILDTTVDFIGCSTKVTSADSGLNYIILYNTLTGILKGFYYAETMSSNNCGFWQLSTSTPTKLFNFLPYFAEPIDGASPQKAIISTVSTNGITDGFEWGWNCFMQELSYDPNSMNQKLNISAFALNKAKVNLSGAYNLKSSGTIVSTTGEKSNLIDGLATGMGSAAKEWVKDNTSSKDDKNKPIKYVGTVVGSVLDKGISGFVSAGLYKVFGSLLGTTKTSMDLNFSTNGSATITGELVNASSGLIPPVAGLNLNNGNTALGIWNLSRKPIFATSRGGRLVDTQIGTGAVYFHYQVDRKITIHLQVNPDFTPRYSYSTSAIYFEKYKGKNNPRLYEYYQDSRAHEVVRSIHPETTLYSDSLTVIKECPLSFVGSFRNLWPNAGIGNNVGAYFVESGFNVTEYGIIKVLLSWNKTIDGKNITFYSSKTFIPNGELYYPTPEALHPAYWSAEELRNRGFFVPSQN